MEPQGVWLMVDPDRTSFDLSGEPVLRLSDASLWVWATDDGEWHQPSGAGGD